MPKHLRWLMIPSLVLGVSVSAYSEKVDSNDARAIAAEFIKSGARRAPESLSAAPIYTAGTPSNPLYYVFNLEENGGFVIVSAEDCANPVLGYSFEAAYPVSSVPEPMQWVMTGLEREIAAASKLQGRLDTSERKRLAKAAGIKADSPKLLATPQWSQEAPFNAMIPGKPLVGCVGTAMATIMKYHQYPATGRGSFDGVDFNTPYSWSSMRSDNYRGGYSAAEGDAVALLMYHASKSIDTQYSMSGSSAYEVRVPAALSNYFGYDPGVSYKKRSDVATQQAWDNIVKDEIDAGRPVLYCGQDVSAGHAFVCDGYQGDYLHFNWGWGGSANGYFLSTALNPTVSRTHNYNNLNTIIYNIKPASGSVAAWSPVHITADCNQPGIGSNLTDLASGNPFKVRVGNLKNLSYAPFSGKVAVALCGADGKMKALLSNEKTLRLDAMTYLYKGYEEFSNCALPAGTAIASGDVVRIMTLADGATEWLPVAGELLTVNELLPATDAPYTFSVKLPAAMGVAVEGETNVIRGWDYSFKAIPENPEGSVLTVKANGSVLTPGNNFSYTIPNVCADQEITVLVQNAADVREKRSVWVETPGTLSTVLPEEEAASVKELTLFGSIDARDFSYIRSAMRPKRVDLTGVHIAAHGTDQANAIPREAFRGIGSLEEVVLPSSVNRMNNGCFRQCGITTITIPAGVKTYEYNVFVGASKLRDIYVGRETAEFINWCVLSGVNTKALTLHVPTERAVNNYKNAENWNTIANIIVDPIKVSDKAMFAVMENSNVNFECELRPGLVEKGAKLTFTAVNTADNDDRMEVYANSTLLIPDAEGRYATTIASNTIIHFDMVAPLEVDKNKSPWTLTAKNGSIGLFTDAVNVIRGQEFTVRVNALNVPNYYEQLYWGMALTDADGNIKEFISPVNVWTAGAGDGFKMNVKCCVKDSEVRDGNRLCLVTSAMKKVWNVVKGADETITDALPAINNMTPVYNINIPEVAGATISGAVSTAVRGRDITLKIVPKNAAYRVDLIENGVEVVKEAASVNYTFIAMEDKDFEINVYDPKEYGSVTYSVSPGELYKAVTAQTVKAHVIVTGEVYATDLRNAFTQDFAQKTVKRLDLSGVTIVEGNGYDANVFPDQVFFKTSAINPITPVIEEVILPNSVVRIADGAFIKCANIKEITLPESLTPVRVQIGTYASGSPKYAFGIGNKAFDGCTSLTTIYIPGPVGEYNGRKVVAHHNPYGIQFYNLGHADASKVTIVVPEENLSVYRAAYSDSNYGNPWKSHGYNILSEYPVYSLNYDANRCVAEDGLDLLRAASFLGDNVKTASISLENKLRLKDPTAKCRVYDNGRPVEVSADGYIPVAFHNPAVSPDKSGDHDIKVVYAYDLAFNSTSDLFAVSEPQVSNENNFSFESFDNSVVTASVLKDVAENSTVRFRLSFSAEHADGLEARVMSGPQELTPDADGFYEVEITNADKTLDIFAVPSNGAILNAEEIAALKPEESTAITAIALEGEMTADEFAQAMSCFPNLEDLDLSDYTGVLPDGAFAGMESLETISLPQVDAIGNDMFSGCSNLTSVDVPASVNSVGEGAFKDCGSLESIRLTGIESIGDNAFAGCDNLTTITLLADVANTDSSAPALKKAGSKGAFGERAFAGMNPNCIVVVDEGVEMPDASANYLLTASGLVSETLPDGTVAEREGRIYSAKSQISLIEGYPLAIPHSFTLEEEGAISLEVNADGWKGIVVPFDVVDIATAGGTKLEISDDVIKDDLDYSCVLYAIDSDAYDLCREKAISANVPYMFRAPGEGKVTFSAASGRVVSTPSEVKADGKEFSLNAVYKETELPATSVYVLNESANAFVPVSDQEGENTVIAPFGVYATSPVGVSEIRTNLPGTQQTSAVSEEEVAVKSLRIVKENGVMVIYSPDSRTETIYNAEGKVVRTLRLHAGRNIIEPVAPGVYIVADTKLLF